MSELAFQAEDLRWSLVVFCFQTTIQQQKDFFSCIRDRRPLRTLNSMKTGYLIQDVRRIELKNLIAKREGGSFIAGDAADEHVSPSVGDASMVIEGEEFAGNVVRYTGSQVVFESDRLEEIAKKLS